MPNSRRRSILKPRNSINQSDEVEGNDNTTGHLMAPPPSTTSLSKKPKRRVSFSSRAEVQEIPTREQVKSMQIECESENEANVTIYQNEDCDMEMTFCIASHDDGIDMYEDENNPSSTKINETMQCVAADGIDMSMTMNTGSRYDNNYETQQSPSPLVTYVAKEYEEKARNSSWRFPSANFDAVDMSMTMNKYERTYQNQPTIILHSADDMSMSVSRCELTYSNESVQPTGSSQNFDQVDMSMTMKKYERSRLNTSAHPTIFSDSTDGKDMSMSMHRNERTYNNEIMQAILTSENEAGVDMSMTMNKYERSHLNQNAHPTIFSDSTDGHDMSMTMNRLDSNDIHRGLPSSFATSTCVAEDYEEEQERNTMADFLSVNFEGMDMSMTMNKYERTHSNQVNLTIFSDRADGGNDMSMTMNHLERTYTSQKASESFSCENYAGTDMSMNHLHPTGTKQAAHSTVLTGKHEEFELPMASNRCDSTFANQTNAMEDDMSLTMQDIECEPENQQTVFGEPTHMDMEITSCHVQPRKIPTKIKVPGKIAVQPSGEIHFRRKAINIVRKEVGSLGYGKFASVQTPKRNHRIRIKATNSEAQTSPSLLLEALHHTNVKTNAEVHGVNQTQATKNHSQLSNNKVAEFQNAHKNAPTGDYPVVHEIVPSEHSPIVHENAPINDSPIRSENAPIDDSKIVHKTAPPYDSTVVTDDVQIVDKNVPTSESQIVYQNVATGQSQIVYQNVPTGESQITHENVLTGKSQIEYENVPTVESLLDENSSTGDSLIVHENAPTDDAPIVFENVATEDSPIVSENAPTDDAPIVFESVATEDSLIVSENAPTDDVPIVFENVATEDSPIVLENDPTIQSQFLKENAGTDEFQSVSVLSANEEEIEEDIEDEVKMEETGAIGMDRVNEDKERIVEEQRVNEEKLRVESLLEKENAPTVVIAHASESQIKNSGKQYLDKNEQPSCNMSILDVSMQNNHCQDFSEPNHREVQSTDAPARQVNKDIEAAQLVDEEVANEDAQVEVEKGAGNEDGLCKRLNDSRNAICNSVNSNDNDISQNLFDVSNNLISDDSVISECNSTLPAFMANHTILDNIKAYNSSRSVTRYSLLFQIRKQLLAFTENQFADFQKFIANSTEYQIPAKLISLIEMSPRM